jgi:hypothetical protein
MGEVSDQLREGMDVYDVEAVKVGRVLRFDEKLGYFETLGLFSGPRYIPFWAIESFGKDRVRLNVTKSTVTEVYNHMPAIRPTLTPEGKLSGTGTVQSGNTGRTVPLDADAIREIRERIHPGTTVLDADDEKLGRIEAYDPETGYMRIEKEGLTEKQIFLPVTSVSFVDDEGIHLSVPKETILMRFVRVPDVARAYFVP